MKGDAAPQMEESLGVKSVVRLFKEYGYLLIVIHLGEYLCLFLQIHLPHTSLGEPLSSPIPLWDRK